MGEGGRRPAGALEAEIMTVLQRARRPLAAAEVQSPLSGDLAYSTVVTILSRMYTKGLRTRAKQGRAFRYSPVSDEGGLVAQRMHLVMAAEPDREAVLSRFVDPLSEHDERHLGAHRTGRRARRCATITLAALAEGVPA
jgi:predicted transcriptional regulator